MSNQIFDTIVIGIGGMGSATCYQLAKRGQRVLGLEQFDIPHNYGSSHGHTRIIRLAYYENPAYIPLLRRAYELWEEIEQVSEEKLLYKIGSVDVGVIDSEVFSGSLVSCKLHDIPYEILSGTELNKRFPAYNVPADYYALYQRDGGFLAPEKAIITFVQAAQQLGASIQAREKVLEWKATKKGVEVRTNKGVYEAEKIIFTAGAWNGNLLPLLLEKVIPERQVLAWLQPTEPALFKRDVFPVFNLQVERERYYGFPIFGVPGFKFGKYCHLKEVIDPNDFEQEANERDEKVLRDFAAEFFPKGNGPTMSLKTCMFTNSPDDHFILDVHPEYANVFLAAGFSGHGYKFASVIGEIMADLAVKGGTSHQIDFLRLGRLLS